MMFFGCIQLPGLHARRRASELLIPAAGGAGRRGIPLPDMFKGSLTTHHGHGQRGHVRCAQLDLYTLFDLADPRRVDKASPITPTRRAWPAPPREAAAGWAGVWRHAATSLTTCGVYLLQ